MAPGGSPPSRISSQPIIWRPCSRRNALTRPTNQDCSSYSSSSRSSCRRAWQALHACQRALGHCVQERERDVPHRPEGCQHRARLAEVQDPTYACSHAG